MARSTSRMPGPWSRATTLKPARPSTSTMPRVSSPCLAYSRMLRASSEMAVAIRVRLLFEKPICWARARPCWRAVTMSWSELIGTRVSSFNGTCPRASARSAHIPADLLDPPVQEGEALLQVEGRGHSLERQAELHHGEGDLGLDADDDCLGPAETDHVGDVAQRARGERVHHVHRRDVHDHAARPVLADHLDQRVTQLQKLGVGQRRL